MKSILHKPSSSHHHKENRTHSKVSNIKLQHSFCAKLTPLHFDKFLPWLCLVFQVPLNVTVKRKIQGEYIRFMNRSSSGRVKFKDSKIKSDIIEVKENSFSSASHITDTDNAIKITAFYNSKGQLLEIAFPNCNIEIDRKVFEAINLCLPFHTTLYKIKLERGLTKTGLYEISKLLPHSNITDVCLDGSFVPEGNYSVLLDNNSHVKNISLKRCHINDEVCNRIADKLHFEFPASKTLVSLDLGSNRITDVGAESLAKMLNKNRTLLYLSVLDNQITDTGAIGILNSFLHHPLSGNDVIARNLKQLDYLNKKREVFKQCENEIIIRSRQTEKENSVYSEKLSSQRNTGISIEHSICFEELTVAEEAEKMTLERIGLFEDRYDVQHVIRRNGQVHAIGNLRLCYLNLAYNNLGYLSVKKIYDVLTYQRNLRKPTFCKGLMKIVLEGNNIPRFCKEIDAIESFLDAAISENTPRSRCHSSKSLDPVKSMKRIHHKTHHNF